MEIIPIGKALEIAKEKTVTLVIGDIKLNITCTPEYLRELGIGFLVSEGIAINEKFDVEVEGDLINVKSINLANEKDLAIFKVRTSGSPGILKSGDKLPKVTVGEKFTLAECQKAQKYLDTEWYSKTRGYHSAAIIGKNGRISQAYDVGRHNAIDKVIGMAIDKNVDFGKVFLLVSGRISEGMVTKCVRSGISLIVSKAAILDSGIAKSIETGVSAVSFATRIAIKGEALII